MAAGEEPCTASEHGTAAISSIPKVKVRAELVHRGTCGRHSQEIDMAFGVGSATTNRSSIGCEIPGLRHGGNYLGAQEAWCRPMALS